MGKNEFKKALDDASRLTGNGYMLVTFKVPVADDGEECSLELSDNCIGVHRDYLLEMLTLALCHYARQACRSRWQLAKDVLRTSRLLAKAQKRREAKR